MNESWKGPRNSNDQETIEMRIRLNEEPRAANNG
jgi:hypothetical protein